MHDVIGTGSAEHHVQLGETEDEAVGLVDEHYVCFGAELLGQQGCQFQPAKARSEDHHSHPQTLEVNWPLQCSPSGSQCWRLGPLWAILDICPRLGFPCCAPGCSRDPLPCCSWSSSRRWRRQFAAASRISSSTSTAAGRCSTVCRSTTPALRQTACRSPTHRSAPWLWRHWRCCLRGLPQRCGPGRHWVHSRRSSFSSAARSADP